MDSFFFIATIFDSHNHMYVFSPRFMCCKKKKKKNLHICVCVCNKN